MPQREASPRPAPACTPATGQAARRRLHGSDSGQALPLALLVLGVGVLMLSMLALAAGVYMRLSSAAAGDLLDYYAADAGIERAIAPLTANAAAYPSASSLSLSLNQRAVAVSVAPLGSQVIPDPSGGMTATVASYLVTARSGELTITARAEARQVSGQPAATVRLVAWRAGQ